MVWYHAVDISIVWRAIWPSLGQRPANLRPPTIGRSAIVVKTSLCFFSTVGNRAIVIMISLGLLPTVGNGAVVVVVTLPWFWCRAVLPVAPDRECFLPRPLAETFHPCVLTRKSKQFGNAPITLRPRIPRIAKNWQISGFKRIRYTPITLRPRIPRISKSWQFSGFFKL